MHALTQPKAVAVYIINHFHSCRNPWIAAAGGWS